MRKPMLPRRPAAIIEPWRAYTSALHYLRELDDLVHRYGGENPLIGSPQSVVDHLVNAIEDFGDTFVTLLDPRHWHFNRLRARHPDSAKPRIDVWVRINRRENLTMCWKPTGARSSLGDGTDFPLWNRHHQLNDFTLVAQRPNNELLYIPEVGKLRVHQHMSTARQAGVRLVMYSTKALVDRVARYLSRFCEVHVLTTLAFNLDKDGHMTDWYIADVEEEWLKAIEARCGMPAIALFSLLRAQKSEYAAAKALRDRGVSIDAAGVRQINDELAFHGNRPGFRNYHLPLFHDASKPGITAKVLSFPTGSRISAAPKHATPAPVSEAARPVSPSKTPVPGGTVQPPSVRKPRPGHRSKQPSKDEVSEIRTNERSTRVPIPRLVSVKTWFESQFPSQKFDSKMVRQWAKAERIQPPPVKMANGLFFDPNATLTE